MEGLIEQARKNKLNESYKPVGIIVDVPVGDGVVVVGITNAPETTAK